MILKNILLVAATVCAVLFTGCQARPVGGPNGNSPSMVYVDGTLKCIESVSQERAHQATLAALKDLQFGLVGDVYEAPRQKVSARTNTDKKVLVVLEKESDNITEIRVSVGLFGDAVLSMHVMEKIKARLTHP